MSPLRWHMSKSLQQIFGGLPGGLPCSIRDLCKKSRETFVQQSEPSMRRLACCKLGSLSESPLKFFLEKGSLTCSCQADCISMRKRLNLSRQGCCRLMDDMALASPLRGCFASLTLNQILSNSTALKGSRAPRKATSSVRDGGGMNPVSRHAHIWCQSGSKAPVYRHH